MFLDRSFKMTSKESSSRLSSIDRSGEQRKDQILPTNQNDKSISDEQLASLTTSSTSSTSQSTTNVSPGKKNKRKMAEPRRRVTDFSIRNICSESTSCSSFASEIESESFVEKRLKADETDQVVSDYSLPSTEPKGQTGVAPLDVLVSLSLLTQHHNHHHRHHHQLQQMTHLNSSALQDIPGLGVPARKISDEKQATKSISTRDDDDDGKHVNISDISNDFSLRFKDRLADKIKIPETSKLVQTSKPSQKDNKALGDDFLVRFKSEHESKLPVEVSSDLISKVATDSTSKDPPTNVSIKNIETSSQNIFRDNKAIITPNSGTHQRKNYKNMTKQRRIEANARERTRVHTISAAFENLRKAVPSYSHNQRLSKLAILRIACSYILALVKLAELEDYDALDPTSRSSPGSLTFSQCVDLCTQTIQSEGKTKRRH